MSLKTGGLGPSAGLYNGLIWDLARETETTMTFPTKGLMIERRSSAVVGNETGISVAVGPHLVLGLKTVVLAVRICSGRG